MHCTCHQQWSSNRSSTFRTCRHIDSISYLSHDWEWMKFSSSFLRTFFFYGDLVAQWVFLGLDGFPLSILLLPRLVVRFICVISFEVYHASASTSDFLAWVFNTLEGCVIHQDPLAVIKGGTSLSNFFARRIIQKASASELLVPINFVVLILVFYHPRDCIFSSANHQ